MSWPTVEVGSVAEIVSGSTPSTATSDYWGGDIPWATPADLAKLDSKLISSTPRTLTDQGLAASSARLLPVGSVLFSSRAPIGHVAINAVPMATNQGFKSFVPDAAVLSADFLYWWLKSNTVFLQGLGVGATFKEVSKSIVERVKIPLPPLPEQRRIASILDHANELRSSGRSSITRAEQFLREYFRDTVSRSNSTISLPLSAITTRITDGTHQAPKWASEGVPFLFVSNIVGGTIDYLTEKFVSWDTYEQLTRHAPIEAGDVLYSAVGSYGVPVLVSDDRPFLFQRHIAHIKPRNEMVNSRYLRDMLASDSVRRQADRVAKGVAQKTVTLGDMSQFSIPMIDRDAQEQYAALASRSDLLRDRLAERQSVLDELFASLQYRAFRGEL